MGWWWTASRATGQAECLAGGVMVMRREDRAVTVGADKAYDTAEFVRTCKAFGAETHAARNTAGRRSNIGEEMAASEGYRASQVHRKQIEEVLGEDGGAPLEDPASRPGWTGSSPWPPTT